MKLLCKLGLHDWKLAKCFETLITRSAFTGYAFGQWIDSPESEGEEIQVHGVQCRRCGARSIELLCPKKDVAYWTWNKAIDWQNEEVIR
jgi:hypothetical protein